MKTLKNQSGFSLVELMVVVAIIGILAAMSAGQVQKQIAKSRQAEGKGQLSDLYTAEKSFFAEYNSYHDSFGLIKYAPEGKMRYNVGWGTTGTPTAPTTAAALSAIGYSSTAPAGAGLNTNVASKFCGTGGTMQNNCTVLTQGITNATMPATVMAATLPAPAFTAGAASNLINTATDAWTINDSKVLTQTTDGIQ